MIQDSIFKKAKRTFIKIRVLKNWYKVILPETRFPYKQEMHAKLRNGIIFHLKSSSFDLPILFQIFWNDIYNLDSISGVKSPKVLDIGGHIGMFAIFVAHKRHDASILSYEPDSNNIKLFNENTSANKVEDQITLFSTAVCKERGERRLFVNPTNTSMNNMFMPKASRGMTDSVSITCTTISDILAENKVQKFDYAKIDCEGAEYELLLGAEDKILSALPNMIIEWHANTDHKPEELVEFLTTKGYEVRFSRKPRMISAIRNNNNDK